MEERFFPITDGQFHASSMSAVSGCILLLKNAYGKIQMHRLNNNHDDCNFWTSDNTILNAKVILKTTIWINVFLMRLMPKAFPPQENWKTFFFSWVIMKKFDLIYLFRSALLIQFIFGIKIPGWKVSYWQRCNKHSQSSSSAHHISPELAGLQCNAEQI